MKNDMTIIDMLAGCVILICVLMSMMRGAVAEAASLGIWVVAFFVAKGFAVPFADIAFKSFQPLLAKGLSFVMLFFGAWLVQRLLLALMTSALSAAGLGGVNRALGAMFGAVKGILLVTLVVMVCSLTDLPKTEGWRRSFSIPYFEYLAQSAVPYLPGKGLGEQAADTDMQLLQLNR